MSNFKTQNTEPLLEMQEEIKPRSEKHGMTSVCPNCGTTFSLEDKNAHSTYCSTKCRYAAAYKRKKKVDPITRDIKIAKSNIKGAEKLSIRYPHHTDDLILELLNEKLQSLENLKNK